MDIRFFDVLTSTNEYSELLDLSKTEEFTVIWAHQQTAGVGQRGNRWDSAAGKNLTFSIILHPNFLPVSQQFMLTKALALAVSDHLQETIHQPCIHIKWPNDIFVGDKKICGILVQNHISKHYESAVCGIGININQNTFPDHLPRAVSLQQITHKSYDLEATLRKIIACVGTRYDQLRANHFQQIDNDYLDRLLYLGTEQTYIYHGCQIRATIVGVNSYGHLELHTSDNGTIVCQLKELQYIFPESH